MVLRRVLILVSVLAVVSLGCSSSEDAVGAAGSATTSAASASAGSALTNATGTSAVQDGESIGDGASLHGVRYCEFLTVTVDDDGTATAEVWNTMLLNDCPQQAWHAVDIESVARDVGADLAVANGPRYWLLDMIEAGEDMAGSGEVRELSGIEMRSVAQVQLDGVDRREPYSEISVLRDTVFNFAAGREIYELTAADGSVYVMQSYSQQADPTQQVADLAELGDLLDLPEGWRFETRVLSEDLDVLSIDGLATVIQDEFQNTYQLRSRG